MLTILNPTGIPQGCAMPPHQCHIYTVSRERTGNFRLITRENLITLSQDIPITHVSFQNGAVKIERKWHGEKNEDLDLDRSTANSPSPLLFFFFQASVTFPLHQYLPRISYNKPFAMISWVYIIHFVTHC